MLAPRTTVSNEMYQELLAQLEPWLKTPQPEPRRLFHGRGHLYPGLEHVCVDWYGPVLLITAYDELKESEQLLQDILALDQVPQIKSVILQQRHRTGAEARCIWGEDIRKLEVLEHGLKYQVQPGVHQNVGLFLDMRPLRQWLRANSEAKNVLNTFAYTCSLSVAALAGKAKQVVSVDMSKPSIQWGNRNHELNQHDLRSVRTVPHNIFRSWGRIAQYGRYDLIIIDPPTRQKGSFNVEKDYAAVLKKLSKLMNPGAEIIATVNSPYLGYDYLPNLMQRYQPKVRLLGQFPVDEQFKDKFPERGLKIYHFKF